MRWFMTLAYNGAGFSGWQVQPGGVATVQGELERALTLLLRPDEPIGVVGAGRTDAGVNARRMTAHFDTAGPIDTASLTYKLNALLPRSIAVESIRPVAPDAHARFSAVSRTYRYFAITRKDPFLGLSRLAWETRRPLDFEAMNEAARLLVGRHDFTSFSKLHTQTATNICTVAPTPCWTRVDGYRYLWQFEITADRFLRNMVRAVVGTLVEVGRGKLTQSGFQSVIESRSRQAAGESMPGEALFLWDVGYGPKVELISELPSPQG